jgi:hypothetical protein
MMLNEFGEIAMNHWKEIPNHYKDTEIDEFTIMPNHMHGIIVIRSAHVGAIHELPVRNQLPVQPNRQLKAESIVVKCYCPKSLVDLK